MLFFPQGYVGAAQEQQQSPPPSCASPRVSTVQVYRASYLSPRSLTEPGCLLASKSPARYKPPEAGAWLDPGNWRPHSELSPRPHSDQVPCRHDRQGGVLHKGGKLVSLFSAKNILTP